MRQRAHTHKVVPQRKVKRCCSWENSKGKQTFYSLSDSEQTGEEEANCPADRQKTDYFQLKVSSVTIIEFSKYLMKTLMTMMTF